MNHTAWQAPQRTKKKASDQHKLCRRPRTWVVQEQKLAPFSLNWQAAFSQKLHSMGRPSRMRTMADRPYTPESLADHWGVSAASVREGCRTGRIRAFRWGKLWRIPADAVREYEACLISASEDCAVDSVSTGPARMESAPAISFRHAQPRARQREHTNTTIHFPS